MALNMGSQERILFNVTETCSPHCAREERRIYWLTISETAQLIMIKVADSTWLTNTIVYVPSHCLSCNFGVCLYMQSPQHQTNYSDHRSHPYNPHKPHTPTTSPAAAASSESRTGQPISVILLHEARNNKSKQEIGSHQNKVPVWGFSV